MGVGSAGGGSTVGPILWFLVYLGYPPSGGWMLAQAPLHKVIFGSDFAESANKSQLIFGQAVPGELEGFSERNLSI